MKFLVYNDFSFKYSIKISETQFESLETSKDALVEITGIEQLFEFLVENYFEFEIELHKTATRFLISGIQEIEWFQNQYSKIVRRILNFLTTSRGYIDQSKKRIQNIGYKSEKIVPQFFGFFSEQYDAHLGYRVIEALRNYSQHYGYPIKSILYMYKRVEKEDAGGPVKIVLTPYIDISDLENDGNFKKSVLDELKKLDKKNDIKPHIRRYMASLGEIHEGFRKLFNLQKQVWDSLIISQIKQFKKEYPDQNIISLQVSKLDDNNVVLSTFSIFENLVNSHKVLEKKNSKISSIHKKFISSEVVTK